MFRTSIRNKLMGLLMAATVIPIATSIVFSYSYTKNSVTKESIRENANLLALGKSNVLNYMNNINQISMSVYHSNNSPNSLFRIVERGTSGAEDERAQEFSNLRRIGEHLHNMYQSESDIYQIHLQIFSNRQSYLKTLGFFRSFQKDAIELPVGAKPGNIDAFTEPTHTSTDYNVAGSSFVPPETVLSLHRPIILTPGVQTIGFLSIDFRIKELFSIFKQLMIPGKDHLYVIDQNQRVIYAEDSQIYGKQLNQGWARTIAEGSDRGNFEWKDDQFSGMVIYDSIKTGYMEWTLVKQLPYSSLYETATRITQFNTLIVIIFLVIVIVATLFISVHFTNPIKNLISQMNKVQSGNFDLQIKAKGSDEMSILARRFDSMVQRIRDLINREYKLEIANVTNQLKALQAQINPHFMNNALQSIGTLALQHGATKVYALISTLGRMMRYNMYTDDTIVPLSAEINHVKDYLELQQQRFEEQLKVSFQIDERLASVKVPKMLLQPLVENYFKHGHGFDQPGGRGELAICAQITDDNELAIKVEDNGTGMDEDKLEALRDKLNRLPDSFTEGKENIGLINVILRLRLYYNENARIEIANINPQGFLVALHIPLAKGDVIDESINR